MGSFLICMLCVCTCLHIDNRKVLLHNTCGLLLEGRFVKTTCTGVACECACESVHACVRVLCESWRLPASSYVCLSFVQVHVCTCRWMCVCTCRAGTCCLLGRRRSCGGHRRRRGRGRGGGEGGSGGGVRRRGRLGVLLRLLLLLLFVLLLVWVRVCVCVCVGGRENVCLCVCVGGCSHAHVFGYSNVCMYAHA